VLSVLTAGLWIISWIALCIGKVMRPWRCEHCGWHKPEFRPPPPPSDPSAAPKSRVISTILRPHPVTHPAPHPAPP
jgi:hypothetical protein